LKYFNFEDDVLAVLVISQEEEEPLILSLTQP